MKDFKHSGYKIGNITHLSPKEAYAFCLQGAILIDVRESFMSHIKTFDVPHILIVPLRKFEHEINKLPKDKLLIFADATGVKSKPACELAFEANFESIANLAGGLVEWERDHMPTNTYQKLLVGGKNKCEFVDRNDL